MSPRGRDGGRRWSGGPRRRPGGAGRPTSETARPAGPREPHPIEVESYRRMRELIDLSELPPLSRAVTERVIHASADLDYAADLVLDEDALAAGREALLAGCSLVVDSRMVAAGITARSVTRVAIDEERAAAVAEELGTTRSAAGMLLAAQKAESGAVYVVGNAPTALFALLEAGVEPHLVVGLPVGFVDAVESKQALRDAGLPSLTNLSAKGGSAVAAAALNALLYADEMGTP